MGIGSGYHPNFFTATENTVAGRSDLFRRLDFLKAHINGGSLIDIGCSKGFNCFGLREQCDYLCGIDHHKDLIAECNEIKDENNVNNVEFDVASIPQNLDKIKSRKWDHCLYLSLHHHILVRSPSAADKFLNILGQHCSTIYVDMGQQNESNAKSAYWWSRLPDTKGNQEKWMYNYLTEHTQCKNAVVIGTSLAFGEEERLLWKLEM